MNDRTIGVLAREAGVGVETIRFYERQGLIEQPLKPVGGGFRIYSDDALRRLRFVRGAQKLGFSLREIGDLMSLRSGPKVDRAGLQQSASAKIEEIDGKIERLREMRAALEKLLAAFSKDASEPRSILDLVVDEDDDT